MKGSTMLDESTLDEIIRRIVEVAHPEKIILFGSAARGDLKAHSDIDLLVVKDDSDPWTVIGDIYGNLRGVGVGVDAIVVTPAQVERYKDSHALVIKPALQEGRVIYEAA